MTIVFPLKDYADDKSLFLVLFVQLSAVCLILNVNPGLILFLSKQQE